MFAFEHFKKSSPFLNICDKSKDMSDENFNLSLFSVDGLEVSGFYLKI